jgi:hypothetical protein
LKERFFMVEKDGWNYGIPPADSGDARRLVTLEEQGMCWVGIRAYSQAACHWMNNGEPERATVKAWKPLDEPARGFWFRGQLNFAK